MEYNPLKHKLTKIFFALLILLLATLLYFYRSSLFSGLFPSQQQKKISGNEQQLTETKLSVGDEKVLQEKAAEIVKTGNLSACQKIENAMYQTVCRNNIILKKAKDDNDATICRQLDNKLVSIKSCESDILVKKSYASDDVSICDEATDKSVQEICKQNVWTIQAVKKNDSNLCQNLDSGVAKTTCADTFIFALNFVPNTRNFDCQKFSTDAFRVDCQTYQKNLGENASNPCMSLRTMAFSQFCNGTAKAK